MTTTKPVSTHCGSCGQAPPPRGGHWPWCQRPGRTLTSLRAAWDQPFLADPSDEAASKARGEQTRALAAQILAAPLNTPVGALTVATAGWSKERGEHADSVASSRTDPAAWIAALGTHEDAVLTSDGKPAVRTAWCETPDQPAEGWVRYEAWTARGCEAHGFVCPDCRKLLQTG